MNFTVDLIQKNNGLFQRRADGVAVPPENSPLMIATMTNGQNRFGLRAQSDRMIERPEEATGLRVLEDGFPQELIGVEPEERGYEVKPRRLA